MNRHMYIDSTFASRRYSSEHQGMGAKGCIWEESERWLRVIIVSGEGGGRLANTAEAGKCLERNKCWCK